MYGLYSSRVYCVSEVQQFFSVLHSRLGDLDVMRSLVNDAHCDPNVKNKDGETPIHWACR